MFQGDAGPNDKAEVINVVKQWVFWGVHLSCLLVFLTGWSWTAVIVCFIAYFVRMFAITGGFHRYFSHRSYNTGRVFQFILALMGTSAAQKGPIWWSSHHRHHHRYSDTPQDVHSPIIKGIYYAHIGWVLSSEFINTRTELVKDLLQFPELRLLDKFNIIPPVILAVFMYLLGMFLQVYFPELGTSGLQMLVWGFFISTVITYHCTFCINSFVHIYGSRRFPTSDSSKNSFFFALLTLGEGWHNNHHYYQGSERQGFYWWEIDITHYLLRILESCGLVWNLREPPERVYHEAAKQN